MPTILVNNTNSIEVDKSAALKYTVQKGAFDVILESTGNDAGKVFMVLRSHAITERYIELDWRDISTPIVASAEALRDLLISWNIPATIISGSVLPTGAATEENQTNGNQKTQVINFPADYPLPAAQVITLTPPPAITDYATATKQTDGSQKSKLVDGYGWGVEMTPTDEIRTVTPVRLVGSTFDGTTIDTNYWAATVANAAVINQANAEVVLSSGTQNNGSAKLVSVRRARYISGVSIGFRAVMQLGDTGAANNIRQWGVGFGATLPTITNGAYFQLSGTTFSIVTLKGSSPTTVNNGSFNGTVASYAVTTNATTFEIYWTNSKVYFVIGGVLIHTVSASATTWAATMNHHIYMQNVNSGNTTNVTLSCRVASIRRFGNLITQPISYFFPSGTTAGISLKLGAGNLHSIIINNMANNATILLADSAAGSTPILFSHTSGAASSFAYALDFKGLPFYSGLRLVVSSANASLTIIYE
jgi:hypothetical protein